VTFEGYLAGRLVAEALKKIPGEPTREALLRTIFNSTFDWGGIRLNFSPSRNQGTDSVYLTVIRSDGTLKAVTTLKRTES
jgi:hypothetical protein